MKIAPSILSSDFSRLGEEIQMLNESSADLVHIDVMDGMFVPNITIGPCVIKSLRKYSSLPFDVHLMIQEPHRYIKDFANAGADIITIHVEAESNIHETLKLIKSFGIKTGLSVKPNTSIETVFPYLEILDMVLVMTVEPGFGGQTFMSDMMHKVTICKTICQKQNLNVEIEIDGGINEDTIVISKQYDVDICVAGTAVFKAKDPKLAIENLKQIKRSPR